jgi:hypothetical protein
MHLDLYNAVMDMLGFAEDDVMAALATSSTTRPNVIAYSMVPRRRDPHGGGKK